jgi:hypothetical protein
LRLIGRKGGEKVVRKFIEIIGLDASNEWETYNLEEDETVVGVYGSVNSAKNLRGLGFIIWKPLE